MSHSSEYPFRPDYAVPPGDTLRERLAELAISQAELAARSGLSTKHINQIIQGVAPITHETALILERVTGTPAGIWNRLEATYREGLLRARQEAVTPADEQWLKSLPIKALQSARYLPTGLDKSGLYRAVVAFFGVADRSAWDRVWTRPDASFKLARAFRSDPGAVAAWLRIAELQVRETATANYDARTFRRVLPRIRGLTRENDFSAALIADCASAGVALAFVPEVGKSRVSGAAWWAKPTRAVIQLSDRYKCDDQFWFAFFHEAAHVLLHSKKSTFVDDEQDPDDQSADGTGATRTLRTASVFIDHDDDDDPLEREANAFATNTLIPVQHASRLAGLATDGQVEAFADEIGISPSIVVGRLHHEHFWDWNQGNHLRRRLDMVPT
jgi:HTH-type transcriptional regulator / antitoxin HigA